MHAHPHLATGRSPIRFASSSSSLTSGFAFQKESQSAFARGLQTFTDNASLLESRFDGPFPAAARVGQLRQPRSPRRSLFLYCNSPKYPTQDGSFPKQLYVVWPLTVSAIGQSRRNASTIVRSAWRKTIENCRESCKTSHMPCAEIVVRQSLDTHLGRN